MYNILYYTKCYLKLGSECKIQQNRKGGKLLLKIFGNKNFMKNLKNKSLTFRIGVSVTLVALIGIALITFQVSYTSKQIFESDKINQLYDSVGSREKIIEDYISSVEEYMIGFSESSEVRNILRFPNDKGCQNDIQDYVDRYSAVKGTFEGLYVCDLETKVIAHTLDETVGVVLRTGADRDALLNEILVKGKMTNRGIMVSPATGQLIISMYYPVFDGDTCLGYVGGAVFADEFMNGIVDMKVNGLEKSEYVFINAATNIYLYNEDDSLFNTETTDTAYLSIIDKVKQGGDTMGNYSYKDDKGDKCIAVYKYIPERNWIFIVKIQESEVFSSYHNLMRIISIISTLVFVLITLTIILRLRSTGKELRQIENAVLNLSKLNLSYTNDLKKFEGRKDECGMIAEAIEKVCDVLKQTTSDISRILTEMAEGNLKVDINKNSHYYIGDFAFLSEVLKKINSNLSEVMGDISTAALQVETGSEQVSQGADLLSNGAIEQSQSIDELASNVLNIEKQIESNADKCDDAQKLMDRTFDKVNEVTERMNNLTEAMEKINKSSEEISSIIKTIEDIAFQTNILALNAAVEAARAGAAGKGFAVVADEVRNLAGKSAEAVKNTSTLIEISKSSVSEGADFTVQVEESISHLEEYSKQLREIIKEVAVSGEQQTSMVADINEEIRLISGVVQTNSATAEQSAAASRELTGQASQLNTLIGKFKIS